MVNNAAKHIDDFNRKMESFPPVGLINAPTPFYKLARLSTHLGGPQIWVKRDDATHISSGGNKLRKLDRYLHPAIENGCDTLVSGGVPQSNSQRQVATAAAILGLDSHLVVYQNRVEPPSINYDISGNVVLNKLFGAVMHPVEWAGDRNGPIEALAESLSAQGRNPYVVPYGVSCGLGALSYASTVAEIAEQAHRENIHPTAIIAASGSGGTQAGLIIGADGCLPHTQIIGIDVDADPDRVRADVIKYMREGAALMSTKISDDKVNVVSAYAGPSYGVPHPSTLEAIRLAASLEAIILDPVYSGKALAGLIGMIKEGQFTKEDTVIFVHTGGMPAVFAYADIF